MTSMDKLQETHDRLVAKMPEGVSCPEGCLFCSGEYASLIKGGSVGDTKTYTEDELQALVAAAVATATTDLRTQLDSLKAGEESAATEAKIAEIEATSKTEIDAITAKLDAAVIDAEQAKKERDELTSWLSAESEKLVAEAEKATRRADRIAQVAAVVTFPEDYVKERAEKWADLDDEQFAAQLEDYKLMSKNAPKSNDPEPLPTFTAMQASRDTDETSVVGSALKGLIRGRHLGIDPRATR